MRRELKRAIQQLFKGSKPLSDTPLDRSVSALPREHTDRIRRLIERDKDTIRTQYGFLTTSLGFRFGSEAWFPRGSYVPIDNDLMRLAYIQREREVTRWFLSLPGRRFEAYLVGTTACLSHIV